MAPQQLLPGLGCTWSDARARMMRPLDFTFVQHTVHCEKNGCRRGDPQLAAVLAAHSSDGSVEARTASVAAALGLQGHTSTNT